MWDRIGLPLRLQPSRGMAPAASEVRVSDAAPSRADGPRVAGHGRCGSGAARAGCRVAERSVHAATPDQVPEAEALILVAGRSLTR
jgi:hypothetical protein